MAALDCNSVFSKTGIFTRKSKLFDLRRIGYDKAVLCRIFVLLKRANDPKKPKA